MFTKLFVNGKFNNLIIMVNNIGRFSKAPPLAEELLAIGGYYGTKSHFSLRGRLWQVAHAWFNNFIAMCIWVALIWLSGL